MSTNMTGGADGGIAIQVRLDTSKASKELNRLEPVSYTHLTLPTMVRV